ncbi:MAG: hypothetical protein H0V41_02235 [Pseudonocardiales bacterium]|nr:hypothetical protein [Pseudonocardiales bacterium]
MAPPPILVPVKAAPAATRDSRVHCERRVDARYCILLPSLASLDRQAQVLSAPQPVATASPPLATRQRVVLLPHARIVPTDTRPQNRRAGRVTGMDQDNSAPQHSTQRDASTRVIAANLQWHDAELALKVARHCFERWRVAGPQNTTTHAYHTHMALHEAARIITLLIEIFRVEANALVTVPARGADIPTQRSDHPMVENLPASSPTTLAQESTQLS